jgi:hypothetical protein
VFLEVLKLIAGILLLLPVIVGVLLAIGLIGTFSELGRSGRAEMRVRSVAFLLIVVMLSVLAGAGAVYLIWESIAAMRG